MNARKIDLRALMDGVELPGVISADVQSNGFYKADTFSAKFSLNMPGGNSLAWWSNQQAILLDIQVRFVDVTDWVSLIVGEIDHIDAHPTTGSIDVSGRDLSARFIETKTQESFQNQTSSEIAIALAARHNAAYGIVADATPTTTPAGRYYQIDHTAETAGQFSHITNEWDLLTYLAQREGFDVYMTGRTLNFHPTQPPDTGPFIISWDGSYSVPVSNVIDLRLERAMTLAKDIEVDVRSWSSKQGRSFTRTAKAIGARSASNATSKPTETQRYVLIRPNLAEDEAQKLANDTLAQMSAHERVISWEMPGEFDLSPRDQVQLVGTQSSWDQTYFMDTVSRSVSFDGGFTQHMRAKNHSPQSEAAV